MPRIKNQPAPQKPIQANRQADQQPPADKPTPAADTPPPNPVKVLQRRIETVTVAVHLGEIGNGYRAEHVEARLKNTQRETMQRILVALRDKRATTADGREVRSAADAFRWLLEQIAEQSQ